MKKTTLLLIFLTAVCANAEWKFDNDTDVQEKGDKRNEEREEARKALEAVRFGVKVEGGSLYGGGIMINTPLSRLNNGNLVLATELNIGFRAADIYSDFYGDNNYHYEVFNETCLSIPLMFQYVSFFYPTSDIQVHWVPSPKRHVFMHLKTIAEAGPIIEIPFNVTYGGKEYKDRNFFDFGGMLGYAVQLESIILGVRAGASYTDFGDYSFLIQLKLYLGYLF
jgi:hypothetical protein